MNINLKICGGLFDIATNFDYCPECRIKKMEVENESNTNKI